MGAFRSGPANIKPVEKGVTCVTYKTAEGLRCRHSRLLLGDNGEGEDKTKECDGFKHVLLLFM